MARAPHIQDLIASRRTLLGGLAGLPLLHLAGCAPARAPTAISRPALAFAGVPETNADTVTVPAGYQWRALIGWGDALFENMPAFDPNTLTRTDQEMRFGTHNDMLALFAGQYAFPPPKDQNELILCANNEYAELHLMFPNVRKAEDFTPAQIEAFLTAIGVSIVELARGEDGWAVRRNRAPGQGRNRRITPFTPVQFTGPAARHPWISAAAAVVNASEPDRSAGAAPEDAVRCGTLANCAGGLTPWGTYLTAEENFQDYFIGEISARDQAHAADMRTFGYPNNSPGEALAPRQFRARENPHGAALYGWIMEIDPYDPASTPKKRTALGRKKNECATTALTADGRVAVYMGDDQRNEHVYKFVSRGRFNPNDRAANRDLLDDGQLYVARLEADGGGRWIALTLDAANAAAQAEGAPLFADEGDLLVRVRAAAQLLGATPMDRPEDVEAVCDGNWRGLGPVLVVCTKNDRREGDFPGNPRREGGGDEAPQRNVAGHIVRFDEAGGDCGAESFTWDIFAMGGDPNAASPTAPMRNGRHELVSTAAEGGGAQINSGDRFACPDNIFIDSTHRIWVSTDGNAGVFASCNDCVIVAPLDAEGPRPMRRFLVGPVGAEICGPLMTPDEGAFLCAIQHPGADDVAGKSFESTRWEGARAPSSFPDGGWPRSTVVIVTREDGGRIGD